MSIECFYNSNVFEIWKKIASENRKESNYKKMEETSDRLVFFDNSFKTPQQNKLKNRSLHTETEKDIRWKYESLEFYMSARVTCRFGSFYVRLPYN